MKIYKGRLTEEKSGRQVIWVHDEKPVFAPYHLPHIERHSPDGFNWGYAGSGPADTALSILTDCLGKENAAQLYQCFKFDHVAGWGNEFSITEQQIKDWARKYRGGQL